MASQFNTSQVAFVAQSMYAPAPIKVKFAKIATAADPTGASGEVVVAAVTGKKIRVLQINALRGSGTTPQASWLSGSTALTGARLVAVASATMVDNDVIGGPYGLFETAAGAALAIKGTNADNRYTGSLVYVEIDGNVNQ